MKRLLLVGVVIVGTVAVVRGARVAADKAVPAGARAALGAVTHVTTVVQRVRREFTAGRAEREAELRGDLLAGADLTRSRELVDAWRDERARSRADHGPDGRPDLTPDATADAGAGPAATPRTRRSGSDADGGPVAARRPRRTGSGSHRLDDPDDGPLGYSFF